MEYASSIQCPATCAQEVLQVPRKLGLTLLRLVAVICNKTTHEIKNFMDGMWVVSLNKYTRYKIFRCVCSDI